MRQRKEKFRLMTKKSKGKTPCVLSCNALCTQFKRSGLGNNLCRVFHTLQRFQGGWLQGGHVGVPSKLMISNAIEYMKDHIFELRRKIWKHEWPSQWHVYAQLKNVVKSKPEKNLGLNGTQTHDLCDADAVLFQLSYQASQLGADYVLSS